MQDFLDRYVLIPVAELVFGLKCPSNHDLLERSKMEAALRNQVKGKIDSDGKM